MKGRVFIALMLVLLLAGAAAAQKSFYNKEFKFGFKAPAGTTLTTDAEYIYAIEPMKGLAKVSQRRGGTEAMINAAEMTKDGCHALSVEDGTPKRTKFGTIWFERTEGVEGGMESVQPYEYYRTFHNGVCYEVRISTVMEKYAKHPRRPGPLLAKFYPILSTFYFK
jgi:hypothetical protein